MEDNYGGMYLFMRYWKTPMVFGLLDDIYFGCNTERDSSIHVI